MGGCRSHLCPVSYTHLDVYKRQLPICPLNEHMDIAGFVMFSDVEITEKTAKALLEKCPEHDIIAVSYTHLDVYKRQVRHGLIGAGVYASHGYERSHVDGVENTLKLLWAYTTE